MTDREIPLTKGFVAIVDGEDYERIAAHKWHAKRFKNGRVYAVRNRPTDANGKRGTILMHREVLHLGCATTPFIDHRDLEATLDNRKSNLRIATRTQNGANRGFQANNKTGYKGVYFYAAGGNYRAQIGVAGKNIPLGYRKTAEAAHRELYVPAAIKYFGEFARVK